MLEGPVGGGGGGAPAKPGNPFGGCGGWPPGLMPGGGCGGGPPDPMPWGPAGHAGGSGGCELPIDALASKWKNPPLGG